MDDKVEFESPTTAAPPSTLNNNNNKSSTTAFSIDSLLKPEQLQRSNLLHHLPPVSGGQIGRCFADGLPAFTSHERLGGGGLPPGLMAECLPALDRIKSEPPASGLMDFRSLQRSPPGEIRPPDSSDTNLDTAEDSGMCMVIWVVIKQIQTFV